VAEISKKNILSSSRFIDLRKQRKLIRKFNQSLNKRKSPNMRRESIGKSKKCLRIKTHIKKISKDMVGNTNRTIIKNLLMSNLVIIINLLILRNHAILKRIMTTNLEINVKNGPLLIMIIMMISKKIILYLKEEVLGVVIRADRKQLSTRLKIINLVTIRKCNGGKKNPSKMKR